MPEEFKEYRRRTRRPAEIKTRKKFFSKKLIYQLFFSLIIFTFVFVVKSSNTPLSNRIDTKIKDVFTYRIDTSGITDAIENILKYNQNTGATPYETQDQQNSQFKDM